MRGSETGYSTIVSRNYFGLRAISFCGSTRGHATVSDALLPVVSSSSRRSGEFRERAKANLHFAETRGGNSPPLKRRGATGLMSRPGKVASIEGVQRYKRNSRVLVENLFF